MISKSRQYGDDCFVTLTEIGVRHRQHNMPNQDAVTFAYENGDYMLAVADGVGSCRRAELGSQAAVQAARLLFLNILSGDVCPSTVDCAKELLRLWRANVSDASEDECCTTIKCVIKIKSVLYLMSVGDGFIAFSSDENQVISPVRIFDFGNETECLNSITQVSDIWTKRVDLRDHLSYTVFVCTDGIANGLSDGEELNLVQSIDIEIPASQLFMQLTDLFRDISHISFDDKTMGVIKHDKRD